MGLGSGKLLGKVGSFSLVILFFSWRMGEGEVSEG